MSVQAKNENTVDIDAMLIKKAQRKSMMMNVFPFAGLVFTILVLEIVTKGLLLSANNLTNIINQCFTTAIVGIGASFVYARGGMDFSIGPSCGVAQLILIASVAHYGMPVWEGVLLTIAFTLCCSLLVGIGSDMLHLQPFIVSLCVRSACSGILVVACNNLGKTIQVPLGTFRFFSNNTLKAIVLLVLLILGYYLFEKTGIGKEQKAIGGNLVTAYQSGIRPRKSVFISHLALGICVGIAACYQMVRAGSVTAQSGSGLEFNIMIALALGGFPMAGGSSAKMRAMIVGVLTITFLTNGLTLAGVDSDYISIIKGLLFIIIVTVSYDRSNLKQVVFM